MSNALKFTETGYVRMSATLESEDEQYYTILTEVIDSGIGVPELVSSTLFTPGTNFSVLLLGNPLVNVRLPMT